MWWQMFEMHAHTCSFILFIHDIKIGSIYKRQRNYEIVSWVRLLFFLILEKGIADVFQGKLRKFSRCSSSICSLILVKA